MTKLNVHEAKTHLSRYLHKVQEGETIILCKKGTPIAQIVPFSPKKTAKKRKLGLAKGKGRLTQDFFSPLTAKELTGFGLK
ncbi:MAG: type II toxin-antitoxin system Phd/YefM family antitoxin [bacterium]